MTRLRSALRFSPATALAALGGCQSDHPQSALLPESPAAESIAWLWWLMFYAFTAVFFIVMFLTLVALLRGRMADRPTQPLGTKFIVGGGIVLPILVVVPLLILSLRTTVALSMPQTEFTIRVIGHQWWWEVEYPDHGLIDANELHIPVGVPVRLELVAADVIHSFWVPRLHGKRDMIPGIVNEFWIQADTPGVYRGQCAEYCGTQHALMAFVVVAHPRAQFDEWVRQRQTPRPPPHAGVLRDGYETFLRACANCHAVRDTPAVARIGPDLTHIGSRRTLGAGTVPNTRGWLAGWTSNPQPIKPGNKMPASFLGSDELLALIEYLESLK